YWAQVLSQRLGYSVTQGEPYSFAATPTTPACNSTSQCVFPVDPTTGLANIPQAAWSAPAVHILPFIPAPTFPGATNNYSNNSQKTTANDDKIGERVDFNNQKTGNWSWYYHFDSSSVLSALPLLPGTTEVPGFPSSTPSRAQQFVMSNAKTLGTTAVNEARISFFRTVLHKDNPAGSFASLSSLGFVTGAGTLGIVPLAGYKEYVPQTVFSQLGFTLGVPTLDTFQPNTTYMVS